MPITILEHELPESELPLLETEVKTTITISEYELPLAKTKVMMPITILEH